MSIAENMTNELADGVEIIVPAPAFEGNNMNVSTAVNYFSITPDESYPWNTEVYRVDNGVLAPIPSPCPSLTISFEPYKPSETNPVVLSEELQLLQRAVLIGKMSDKAITAGWRFYESGIVFDEEQNASAYRVTSQVADNGLQVILTIAQVTATPVAGDTISFRYVASKDLPTPPFTDAQGKFTVHYSQDPQVGVRRPMG
ncbi:hypothetical protein HWQ46_09325 [Shewanella sp. D64]|uniref:hypothetical protein n=1 Tax=unclassified Shewanella TaxID=196818 RepID=UPI0022BA65D9|nr:MULTISPECIES: hypothetical protein [unclassified Shewanella]MEC4725742.1 hypothetical protein [Shewanella sp. D64]MEC4737651.1 hypothetical protein [Shewanella sp. E94]WBJ93460.1 hypothetical protein HWQ47_16160 [Shewanella sp. MTB7]